MLIRWLFCILLMAGSLPSRAFAPAAADSDSLRNTQRFYVASGMLFSGGLFSLYQAWYKPYNFGHFRFFNDTREWRGIDKLGHFSGTWWACQWLYETASITGLPVSHRMPVSLGLPLLFMTTVEIFDGFSSGYGFSPADVAANVAGASLFYLQQKHLGRQDFTMKISFSRNDLNTYRPELLGRSWPETWLKNYNGQTHWLSYPIKQMGGFFRVVPGWVCISAGYSAGGMLGGITNRWVADGKLLDYTSIKRYSRYLISFDIDLLKLPFRGKAWRFFTSGIRWVKIPFPALEYSIQGWKAYALYW